VADLVRDAIAADLALLAREVREPEAPFGYGVDLVCVSDLDPRLATTDPTTTQSLAQDLFHRCTTARGTLPDDPDYGEAVQRYLSAGLTQRELISIAGRLASECQKDDRVAAGGVNVTLTPDGISAFTVSITVEPADPDLVAFTLIMAVSNGEALLKAIAEAA
jgi:hypothetical protein